MKLSMRQNLITTAGEFKMKYSGYFLLPLMIFSSDYVAAGVLNGTADNGTACSSSSPMMAADGKFYQATP